MKIASIPWIEGDGFIFKMTIETEADLILFNMLTFGAIKDKTGIKDDPFGWSEAKIGDKCIIKVFGDTGKISPDIYIGRLEKDLNRPE